MHYLSVCLSVVLMSTYHETFAEVKWAALNEPLSENYGATVTEFYHNL